MDFVKIKIWEPQVLISCHINKSFELEPVNGDNETDLRDLFYKKKMKVRSLKVTGIHEDQVRPLLIPIVLENTAQRNKILDMSKTTKATGILKNS